MERTAESPGAPVVRPDDVPDAPHRLRAPGAALGRLLRQRRLRRAGGLLVVASIVMAPVAVHREAAEARRAASAARADAADIAAARERAEAEVDARLVELDAAYAAAIEATAARNAQRDRLVELQLAEDTLGEVVAEARRDTTAVEAEQQSLDGRVQQQAVDLPQLEGCLAEVRPLVDTAFLATVNPGVEVPSISPACRSLLDTVGADA